MLCQNCWKEEAWVHFRHFGAEGDRERSYCLACAQHEPLSWLIAWGYGKDPSGARQLPIPESIVGTPSASAGSSSTLVGTGLVKCACGCRVVVGAEVSCGHRGYRIHPQVTHVGYVCHCGRELTIPIPRLVCPQCGATDARAIIAAVETCLWDEQRRRIVSVDNDMQRGQATWGTFAILN